MITGSGKPRPPGPATEASGRRAGDQAFTLVELLVTIGIIAMLAGIIMPAVHAAIKRAYIARAQTEMGNIVAGIKAYFREYGIMPTPDTNGFPDHFFTSKLDGTVGDNPRIQSQVINILRAVDTEHNKRRIVFVEVNEKSMVGQDKDLQDYTVSDGYYLDPWENPYMIVMDTDFDGEIGGFAGDVSTAEVENYIVNQLSAEFGCFPGITVVVLSHGPEPGKAASLLATW